MRVTCERRSSRASPSLANFYATIGRRYVAIVREAEGQVVQVQSTDQCELPHLHAVARQLEFRRPSPEASSIADAALATSFRRFQLRIS